MRLIGMLVSMMRSAVRTIRPVSTGSSTRSDDSMVFFSLRPAQRLEMLGAEAAAARHQLTAVHVDNVLRRRDRLRAARRISLSQEVLVDGGVEGNVRHGRASL